MTSLDSLRTQMRDNQSADERAILSALVSRYGMDEGSRAAAVKAATRLVEDIRRMDRPGLMEVFLAEYGLSTQEGIALMCLAESLLRVPDAETIDALIEDKIAPSQWGRHLGKSASPLVNASTWALMLTGNVLSDTPAEGLAAVLRGAIRRLGEPVIRTAVRQAMRELGQQFVLGRTIGEAMERAARLEAKGYTYSYDMLGEAAMTAHDADAYLAAYAAAVSAIAPAARHSEIAANPGISVKLSALHPRYEELKRETAVPELAARTADLAAMAASAGIGFNIDAEEADRLELSLDVIETVLADPRLSGWDGFGIVVQAYGKRATHVIEWTHALAAKSGKRMMVRLVKGAYWDSEIKRAQVAGLSGFPVFARKASTDVSYLCCANQLLGMRDRIYPQFATHNAHSVAAILQMAGNGRDFEFQRLHGMGDSLHERVRSTHGTRCRVYAPVGAHRDLLAYLVRRLLENGANSSFVNQIIDLDVPAARVAADPFADIGAPQSSAVRLAADLFAPDRKNSAGHDLSNRKARAALLESRLPFETMTFAAAPMIVGAISTDSLVQRPIINLARPDDQVGTLKEADAQTIAAALDAARPWGEPSEHRAAILEKAADALESDTGAMLALLAREAGKTIDDGIAEIREAVDFLRYYACEARVLGEKPARGIIGCISPWNFPLAIFIGQIAGALAAGNGVIAKPAEATPLIAARAIALLHEVGVPVSALQFLPGDGPTVGAPLTSDSRLAGVCFTGSTATARAIDKTMAQNLAPDALLIAETGGINAMVVDSTALPEQAVRDVIQSAFRSAGQRCSALRVLYVQEDVAPNVIAMLTGAMQALKLGDPLDLATDIGPVIDARAKAAIDKHVADASSAGRLIATLEAPSDGTFCAPAIIRVNGIDDVEREIFGPVLHVATFRAADLDKVIDAINRRGFGLTFGLHTRIDDRVETVSNRVHAGNIYVNRNQIGAVVGSQPFGGEGLSGTGPKAGGPLYVERLTKPETVSQASDHAHDHGDVVALATVEAAIAAARTRVANHPLHTVSLAGPTGESNRYAHWPRGVVLCLGPDLQSVARQVAEAEAVGCGAVGIAPGGSGEGYVDGRLDLQCLQSLNGIDVVVWHGDQETARRLRVALAHRTGAIVPLVTGGPLARHCIHERHVSIDTTAAGGNASLLSAAGNAD